MYDLKVLGENMNDAQAHDDSQERLFWDGTKIFRQMNSEGRLVVVGLQYVWNNGEVGEKWTDNYDPKREIIASVPARNLDLFECS